MGLEIQLGNSGTIRTSWSVDVHSLNHYIFDSGEAILEKKDDSNGRTSSYSDRRLRTSVGGVLLVELFGEPHALLLHVRNSSFQLPGGRLRPGETDVEELKRKLLRKLAFNITGQEDNQTPEYLGFCWSDLYGSAHSHCTCEQIPKECTKVFLVRLPRNYSFEVPRNLKLLAIPLIRIKDNPEVYGPVISLVQDLLSGFSLNMVAARG
ncbi:pre-mRNA cleavage factor Im 25 kDa subunit 1-like [Wolffia australiana]